MPAPAAQMAPRAGGTRPVPLWTGAQVAAAVAAELVHCRRRLRATRRRRLALQRQETALRARITHMSETAHTNGADSANVHV
jgi:hypothetical protein